MGQGSKLWAWIGSDQAVNFEPWYRFCFTIREASDNWRRFVTYDSIVVQRSFESHASKVQNISVSFPLITVCSNSMHSKAKEMGLIFICILPTISTRPINQKCSNLITVLEYVKDVNVSVIKALYGHADYFSLLQVLNSTYTLKPEGENSSRASH